MADYNNTIFKPRKNSGFVVKFRFTPDKAGKRQRERERDIATGHYDPYAGEVLDFHKTFYIRSEIKKNSLKGYKVRTDDGNLHEIDRYGRISEWPDNMTSSVFDKLLCDLI